MRLKRFFGFGTDEVSHVNVSDKNVYHNFSPRFIVRGVQEGWITFTRDTLTIKSNPPVVYTIVRGPGHYCCFCNEKLGDSTDGKLHVETVHNKEELTDSTHPSGFRKDNFYFCHREDEVSG